MNFSAALMFLKMGRRVTRLGWNGKNQYIELASNISYKNSNNEIINADHETMGNQAIVFNGSCGIQVGWLASQADIFSDDWVLID